MGNTQSDKSTIPPPAPYPPNSDVCPECSNFFHPPGKLYILRPNPKSLVTGQQDFSLQFCSLKCVGVYVFCTKVDAFAVPWPAVDAVPDITLETATPKWMREENATKA